MKLQSGTAMGDSLDLPCDSAGDAINRRCGSISSWSSERQEAGPQRDDMLASPSCLSSSSRSISRAQQQSHGEKMLVASSLSSSPQVSIVSAYSARCHHHRGVSSSPVAEVPAPPVAAAEVSAQSAKVVHFLEVHSSGTTTPFFKAKVALPTPRATMKDLAKVALKRLVGRFRLTPTHCSIRDMQIFGNGASLCASDYVHSVVGPDEEILFLTNIADSEERRRVVASEQCNPSAPQPPQQHRTTALTTHQQQNGGCAPLRVVSTNIDDALTSRKRSRSSCVREPKRSDAPPALESTRRRLLSTLDDTPMQTAATELTPPAIVIATPADAVASVQAVITTQLVLGLFSHIHGVRRAIDLGG